MMSFRNTDAWVIAEDGEQWSPSADTVVIRNYDDTAQEADDADLLEWYHDAIDVVIWAAGMYSACGEYPRLPPGNEACAAAMRSRAPLLQRDVLITK